jgi:hypothetical protein
MKVGCQELQTQPSRSNPTGATTESSVTSPARLSTNQKNMNAKQVKSRFSELGVRLKVREIASRWQMGSRKWIDPADYAIDIRSDRGGAFF